MINETHATLIAAARACPVRLRLDKQNKLLALATAEDVDRIAEIKRRMKLGLPWRTELSRAPKKGNEL